MRGLQCQQLEDVIKAIESLEEEEEVLKEKKRDVKRKLSEIRKQKEGKLTAKRRLEELLDPSLQQAMFSMPASPFSSFVPSPMPPFSWSPYGYIPTAMAKNSALQQAGDWSPSHGFPSLPPMFSSSPQFSPLHQAQFHKESANSIVVLPPILSNPQNQPSEA